MRYLVLTIAAIAAAQIAFQLFVVDDYAPKYKASVAANVRPADTIVTVRGDANAAPSQPGPPIVKRVKHSKAAPYRSAPSRTSYRPQLPEIRPSLTAKAPAAKTSPKKAPRADGPDRKDEDHDDDGKPWIAKALPVVKKPYDWLKALGSKLK